MRTLTEIGEAMESFPKVYIGMDIYYGPKGALLCEALTVVASTVSMKSTADAISRIVRSYKGEE